VDRRQPRGNATRYFVAVADTDADVPDGATPDQPPGAPRIPPIEVTFNDGKVTTIEP
jgi:hypothetical protein